MARRGTPLVGRIALAILLANCPLTAAWSRTSDQPASVVPPIRPDRSPPTVRPSAPAPQAPQPARPRVGAVRPFTLRLVRIENASLPAAAFEPAWRPFVGRVIDANGLQQLVDALATVYAASDVAIYTLVAPAQSFEAGTVRIRAIEGRIAEARISGPEGRRNRSLVEARLAKLRAERPLRRSDLEREVSLIRDIPGLESAVTLQNGAADGDLRVDATLTPHPAQLGLSISNRGTAYLGRTQVQADLHLNSLFNQGDHTRFSVAVPTDTRRFQAYSFEHSQPIGADGLLVTVNANVLTTRPKDTGLVGHATSLGLQASYPLLRTYEQSAYITAGIDGADTDNAFLGFRFASDRVRAVRMAASYSRQTERSLGYFSATLSHGLSGLGARTTPGLATTDFNKLNLRAGGAVAIGDRAALRLNVAGQATADRLPGTEQFALGGAEFGRGYEAAIVAGDYGLAGAAELAYRPAGLPALIRGSEAYAFLDGGKVWYRGRLGAPLSKADLASSGIGVRVQVTRRLIAQLEAAKPFSNPLPTLDRRGWRGIFEIRTLF